MFRKTFTGSLVAASLTASALMSMSTATAAPTYLNNTESPSGAVVGNIPVDADVVMSENGSAVATWTRLVDGEQRVQAAYFRTGASAGWSDIATISPAGKDVAEPHVAINDKGEAVAAWLQEDLGGNDQLTTSRHSGFGAWSNATSTGVDGSLSAKDLDVALDGNGQLFAAATYSNNADINRVRVVRVPKSGGSTAVTLSDNTAGHADIAVNSSGQAVLAYNNPQPGDDFVDTRRFTPANGTWSSPKSVAIAGVYLNDPKVAIGDNGSATVVYVMQDIDADFRVTWNRLNADGTQSSPAFISPDGTTSVNPSIAQNDAGAAVMAWSQSGSEVGYRTRAHTTAGWATGSAINAGLSGTTAPQAAISDNGSYMIGWTDDGDLHGRYRGSAVLPFVTYDSAAIAFGADNAVGIDNQGNAFTAGTYALPDPAKGSVHVKFLDAGGPTSTMGGVAANTLNGKAKLTWSASDRFSDVTAYDVRVKTTAWNSTIGKYTSLQTGGPATSLDFTAAPGRTYCFEVRARDAHANYGAYTAPKCTTTPVDDRAGVIAKGFKRAKAATSYRGTYSIAKKKNAVMSFQHVKASRIAVLVTKLPKGGKIQVKFAGKVLGTYSLKGSGNQKLVAAKNFGSVKSGTLVIKVVSKTGKVVRIDGVVIAK